MAPAANPNPSSLVLSQTSVAICRGADTVSARSGQATASHARERGERFPPLYRLLRLGCKPLLRWLFDLRIRGIERLPASGPFIVAANHHNYVDGVVLGAALPRPIAFVVMPRVFNASPLHPAFHRRIGSIPVSLERPDPGAIRRVLRVLESGRVIGIFPEGPFSHEGRLVPGQPGVAMIALRSGMPVVPAAIDGTYEALVGRRFYVPRRHPLSVCFGAPMHFGCARNHRVTRAEREDVTRRIMAEIAALLGAERTPSAITTDQSGTS
jgi:1-acyl-sn-glycerol-3-phosphate acyltransferase